MKASQIAQTVGCSRQTVWTHTRAPKPTPLGDDVTIGAPGKVVMADVLGWPEIAHEVVNRLREMVRRGNVQAAVQLARLAAAEARDTRCQNHVEVAILQELLLAHFEVWKSALEGPYARRVVMEMEADPVRLGEMLQDLFDDVARELNATAGAAAAAE